MADQRPNGFLRSEKRSKKLLMRPEAPIPSSANLYKRGFPAANFYLREAHYQQSRALFARDAPIFLPSESIEVSCQK